jgi:hypothetical protein
MVALLCFFLTLFGSPFKSKSRFEAENSALRHQLIVLQRRVSGGVQLTNGDRLFLVMLYRWFPSILQAITIRSRGGLGCTTHGGSLFGTSFRRGGEHHRAVAKAFPSGV